MSQRTQVVAMAAVALLLASPVWAQGKKPLKKCAKDAVVAGTVCMDMYEASVWRVADPLGKNKGLVKKIQQGKVKPKDLTKGGAIQLGTQADSYGPCANSGQNCADDIYAVSLPGVTPARFITWFQAQEACANARKRLPTSAEWQVAANGTPDTGGADDGTTTCNTDDLEPGVTATGSRTGCVSARGAWDMVGNLAEWTTDWVPRSPVCPNWGPFSDDLMCLSGASTTTFSPGALLRGGRFSNIAFAGPLSVDGTSGTFTGISSYGFRCAR